MKSMTPSTAHWIVLAIINAACIFSLMYSPSYYMENISYQTMTRQWLEDSNQLNTEEYLTIGHGRLTQTTLESLNGKIRNATISAQVIRESNHHVQIKINNVKLSQDNELFAIEKTPDLFFRRQFILQEGTILNYELLPTADKNSVCFYVHDVGRLRCMNH
ncbi:MULTISPECIES: hypothetical protein [Pseudomonas]|jgi:hypothetical protein|uniref:Uncharacterized protein n=1 Tax=Pseudomonas umsongensis TaxID=198618 RepID=A0AAE6ZWB8_9PSED|nr:MULTISPECIES: hypothetical protein [Pseudomonas]EPA92285.1 hypothetical protein PG5_66010 [Pseudomonas sp. G5(2012)]QJC79281.1 hypothetical protein HGP31_13495 [Pseudomonas umsongensis]